MWPISFKVDTYNSLKKISLVCVILFWQRYQERGREKKSWKQCTEIEWMDVKLFYEWTFWITNFKRMNIRQNQFEKKQQQHDWICKRISHFPKCIQIIMILQTPTFVRL